MVEIARAAGQLASLPGSGGAALVLLKDRGAERSLAEAYAARGYRFAIVRPA